MLINTVTVIGANGTMGRNVAAIFASFGNTKVYMIARSLQDAKNAKKKAVNSVRAESIGKNLIPKTYEDLEECLGESDFVFESVAENIEVKRKVYAQLQPFLQPHTVIGTGTSGLSINELSKCFNSTNRQRFLGTHMFNPPYNLSLCEVIPSKETDSNITREVKEYMSKVLLRDVVEVKDTPAFMGNRIGFQFINEALQLAVKYKEKGGIDYIDALFGGVTGRTMPPLVTSDFVGLDVHKAIVDNLYKNTNDYEHETFKLPDFVEQLIIDNKLGRKTGEGLYRKQEMKGGRKIQEVFDITTKSYRPTKKYDFKFVDKMKKHIKVGKYKEALETLFSDSSDEAEICLRLLMKYSIYSIYVSELIGEDIHSSDHVMANGFNWIPPLAFFDALRQVSSLDDIFNSVMSEEYLSQIKAENLASRIERSEYDYRSYLKAK